MSAVTRYCQGCGQQMPLSHIHVEEEEAPSLWDVVEAEAEELVVVPPADGELREMMQPQDRPAEHEHACAVCGVQWGAEVPEQGRRQGPMEWRESGT